MTRSNHPTSSWLPAAVAAAGSLLASSAAPAAIKSWTTGNGQWSVGANWSPVGVPGALDSVHIGNLFFVKNDWVTLDQNVSMAQLSITDGMVLDGAGKSIVVTGPTVISGSNTDGIVGYSSRLLVDQGPAANDALLKGVSILDGGGLEVRGGATARLEGLVTVGPSARLGGEGHIVLTGPAPVAMVVDGTITKGTNGLTISQLGAGRIDLDGTLDGDDTLNITLSKIDGSGFASLAINGTGLTDTFDDDIWLSSHNALTMNLAEGWTLGPGASLRVFRNASFPGPAQVGGSSLLFQGELNMTGSGKHLAFGSPVVLAPTAHGTLGTDGLAEFNAGSTVAGGPWVLGNGARVRFNGSTSISGGDFVTFSANPANGSLDLNGSTSWNGHLSVAGVARQRGQATVTGPSSVTATRFDMDGDGAVKWSIGNSMTVNAAYIDTGALNIFNGEIVLTGTFLGKLAVNLEPPSSQWTMAGSMSVGGVAAIMLTRVVGSQMRVTGDLDVTGRVQITADTVLANGATITLPTPTTTLRLSGSSRIEQQAAFIGDGVLEVGATGDLTIDHGTSLVHVGLRNFGSLRLDAGPGLAFAASLECGPAATWSVDIGGHAPGDEHDLLVVTTGDVSLAGALDLRVVDAGAGLFVPQVGDSFAILTAPGTVSGAFDNAPVSFVPGWVYLWSIVTGPSEVLVQLDEIVPCPADLSGDGLIDGADLGILLGSWGPCAGCLADLSQDGLVDGTDLGLLLASWGACAF